MKSASKIFIVLLFLMTPLMVWGQGDEKEKNEILPDTLKRTSYESLLVSYLGDFIKIIDYPLYDMPMMPQTKGTFQTYYKFYIREVIINDIPSQFLRLNWNGQISTICYLDVIALIKSSKQLQESFANEDTSPENECRYIENKYATDDYLDVGYFLRKKSLKSEKFKSKWFVDLDTRKPYNTNYLQSLDPFIKLLEEALIMMDELREKNGQEIMH